jgi:hypothetical protein
MCCTRLQSYDLRVEEVGPRRKGRKKWEVKKTDSSTLLYSSIASVQNIFYISILVHLHVYYRVGTECFCSGSSRCLLRL